MNKKEGGEGVVVITCIGAIIAVILLIALMFKVFAP